MKELKIKSIKKLNRKEHCYDIQVQDTQRYFSNNILSHNSTILDAIVFALFGRVIRDVKLTNIVNEKINKNCKVELNFNINNHDYWIVRYRKHEKFYDTVRLYKDEKNKEHLISKANKSDTQELIDNLIHFNYKSFIGAVMMSQENISSFIEADPWKKKEIIENILQLSIMTKYHWIAQQKRKIIKRDVDKLELEIDSLKQNINNTKKTMIEYVNSCKKAKKEKDDQIQNIKNKLKEINNINLEEEFNKIKEAKKLTQNIEAKMIESQKIADLIKNKNDEKSNLESSISEYNLFIKNNKSELKKLNKELKKINKEISDKKIKIEEVKLNPKKCPLCGNKIDVEKLNDWISNEKIIIDNDSNKINEINVSIENNETKINEWNNKISELKNKIKKINKEIKLKEEEKSVIEKEYKNIKIPKIKDEEELRKHSERRAELEAQLKILSNKKIIDENYLHSLKKQAEKTAHDSTQKKIELNNKKKKFIITEWWENSLSSKKNSMKSWCINNIIGYFNLKIKYYVDRFFDGEVEIKIDNELNETITKNGKKRTFGMFSKGERRRLNLAILFALYSLVKANISTKINIMFLDEVLSNHLDDKGISNVLEILDEAKIAGETVFIIEHRSHFKDYPSFKNIKIYKDNNDFSHIKVI